MEEEWDIVNSLNSSLNTPEYIEKSTSVELNFNRFANQPEFNIEDDGYPDDYDQQLMDEGVIFCDSPTPPEEEEEEEEEEVETEEEVVEEYEEEDENTVQEDDIDDDEDINFTLGDSKLINNDTIFDDVQNNNELEQQRINQYKNDYLSSFFPVNNFMSEQENNTRESQVDKKAIWKNTQAGPSVPYISSEMPKDEEQEQQNSVDPPKFTMPFPSFSSTNFSFGGNFSKPSRETEAEITQKLSELQFNLSKNEDNRSFNSNITSTEDERGHPLSTRPMKQLKGRFSSKTTSQFMSENLPAFAASPKSIPTLSVQHLHNTIDIPPTEVIDNNGLQYEQDPDIIQEALDNCFQFTSRHHGQITSIYLNIQKTIPDITQWYQLKHLDLSRQNLTGLNHLDTCFPMLESLNISHNELKSISGLPTSLCYLHASHNKLNEVDIYHLTQLQRLDVSHNFIIDFEDMSQLKALRSLDASNNNIHSCKPFQNLNGLIVLSLKANSIRKLTGFNNENNGDNYHIKRSQLESLDISFNRIECLEAVDSFNQLRELDANHNNIKSIQLDQPMTKLCKLKLSFNRLKSFDVSPFPDVRTLYLDDNQIERIIGVACISRLDSFSLRDQGRQKVEFNIQYLRGTRKLYLSGSPFKKMHQMVDFYSLETLELCSVGLEDLPSDFNKMVPNLINLYLSMNRLQDIRPLKRLKYLRRLILIDNRLLSLNEVIAVVKHLKKLHVLDLRQNPMCSNIYPALDLSLAQDSINQEKISPYITTAHDISWGATDMEFRQTLPDHWKTRRDVYRAFMIKECHKLDELDHLPVTPHERLLGDQVIDNFHKKSHHSSSSQSSL